MIAQLEIKTQYAVKKESGMIITSVSSPNYAYAHSMQEVEAWLKRTTRFTTMNEGISEIRAHSSWYPCNDAVSINEESATFERQYIIVKSVNTIFESVGF